MWYNSADPYYDPYGGGGGGDYGGGGGDGGGEDTGITGGSDPTSPPTLRPGPNGWWEFIGGVWRWMTDPVPRALTPT